MATAISSAMADSRLNLSLDALIKERKKEDKTRKRDVVQQETTKAVQSKSKPDKVQKLQKQSKKIKTTKVQSHKRNTAVSTSHGLPSSPEKKSIVSKQQFVLRGVRAKVLRRMQLDAAMMGFSISATPLVSPLKKMAMNAPAASAGNVKTNFGQTFVILPRQGVHQQQAYSPKYQQHNSTSPGRHYQLSPSPKQQKQHQQRVTISPKQQLRFNWASAKTQRPRPSFKKSAVQFINRPQSYAAGANFPKQREVHSTGKRSNLQITLNHSSMGNRRIAAKPQHAFAMRKLKPSALKVVLPGKSQPKTRKVLAQTLVGRVKASRKPMALSVNATKKRFVERKSGFQARS